MKGPTPHIEFILMAVAEISPIDWWKCGFSTTGVSACVTSGLYLWLFTQLTRCLTARDVHQAHEFLGALRVDAVPGVAIDL